MHISPEAVTPRSPTPASAGSIQVEKKQMVEH